MEICLEAVSGLSRLAISPSGFTFDPQTGKSFTLNTTGMEVVNRLREGRSQSEIVSLLSQEYGLSTERVEADLSHFVGHLKRCLS